MQVINFYKKRNVKAFVAQSVERKSHNLKVARSSPAESKCFSFFCSRNSLFHRLLALDVRKQRGKFQLNSTIFQQIQYFQKYYIMKITMLTYPILPWN